MKKRILSLTILCLSVYADQGMGTVCHVNVRNYNYYPNDLAIATGTVAATGRNSIDINDEEQKRVLRFVYLNQDGQYHKGDYIRVYYHPESAIVVIIKKMTVLRYDKNGQNLGYLQQKAQ